METPEALTFSATEVVALVLVVLCGMRLSPSLVAVALSAYAISRGVRTYLQIKEQRQ